MRRTVQQILFVAAVLLLATGPALFAKTIYVDDDAPLGGDGASWTTAYQFLQDALAEAEALQEPVEIRVAQGVYRPDRSSAAPEGSGDRLATFRLTDAVTLKGGYGGLAATDPNDWDVNVYATVLSGDLAGDDVLVEDPCDFVEYPEDGIWTRPEEWCPLIESTRRDNSVHIVSAVEETGAATLVGFTVTAGHAYYPPYWWTRDAPTTTKDQDYGGALFHQGMALTLRACTFLSNSAIGPGGAVYSLDSSRLALEDCRFLENYSFKSGAALRVEETADMVMTRCVLENNEARGSGAAIYARNCHFSIGDCRLEKNLTTSWGGTWLDRCVGTFSFCEFKDNRWIALACGGSDLRLAHCTFTENSGGDGGGIRVSGGSARLDGCTLTHNHAGEGGAIFLTNAGELAVTNCLFTKNVASQAGGAISGRYDGRMILKNSIFWNDIAPDGSEIRLKQGYDGSHPSSAIVSHCLVKGGMPGVLLDSNCTMDWGPGNIDTDPCFIDPGYWDENGTVDDSSDDFFVEGGYHLRSQAGRWDPTRGNWVQDEVTSPCIDAGDPNSPIMHEPFPNGGVINMGAYGGTEEASKSYFGGPPCETIIAGDINGDCRVDLADIAILLDHWLETGQKATE